ncbi:hypothetical protein ACF0H5_007917 [Mactra antiquata]
MKVEALNPKMATATINGLQVRGEAAPKNTGAIPQLPNAFRANKPGSHMTSNDRSFQFVMNRPATVSDLTITSLTGPSVPVRKMEHLSRVRTANYGMSTMDASDEMNGGEQQSTIIIDKPHFVLCGLPVGSKEIDHHLYVNETRVGSYKTSAKAVYQARRVPRSSKAMSEPAFISPEKEMINYNTNLTETVDESGKKSVPPIPPTTPVNYAHYINMMSKSKQGYRPDDQENKFLGSIPSTEVEHKYVPSNMLLKHRKMTLLRRDQTNDSIDLQREHSSVSTRSGKSISTVSESVINNSLTVTSGKAAKLASRSLTNSASKVNYNNPYRNTKYKGRLALNVHKRIEFETIDGYFKYQRQNNGRHILTPRAVLRIPKPCSDTFLVQMMYELNHPKRGGSANYSDVARTKDLEEFVQTRTSSSLSKTQSNIDKFMGKRNSAKSRKSNKSAKSGVDAETIHEEDDWADENIIVNDNINDN